MKNVAATFRSENAFFLNLEKLKRIYKFLIPPITKPPHTPSPLPPFIPGFPPFLAKNFHPPLPLFEKSYLKNKKLKNLTRPL